MFNLVPERNNGSKTRSAAVNLAWGFAACVVAVELYLFHWLFHFTENHLIGRASLVGGILAELLVLGWFTSVPRAFVVLGWMIVLEAALFHWSGHMARTGATGESLRLVNFLSLFVFVTAVLIALLSVREAEPSSGGRRDRR